MGIRSPATCAEILSDAELPARRSCSRERIENFHSRRPEIPRVPSDDGAIVRQCRRRDQAVLDGQRPTGFSQVGEEFCPAQTCRCLPRYADDPGNAFFEPLLQSSTAASRRQKVNAEPNLAFASTRYVNGPSQRGGRFGFDRDEPILFRACHQPIDESLVRRRRFPPHQPVLAAVDSLDIELLTGLDPIKAPYVGGQDELSLRGNSCFHDS